jgi:hypothetical protein
LQREAVGVRACSPVPRVGAVIPPHSSFSPAAPSSPF